MQNIPYASPFHHSQSELYFILPYVNKINETSQILDNPYSYF
jgi:hypothetical protein